MTMKFAVLFLFTILSFGETMAFAHPSTKRTHVRYMQALDTKNTLGTQTDLVNAFHAPVGPTDGEYGNIPVW
jgi:hypothetical protein